MKTFCEWSNLIKKKKRKPLCTILYQDSVTTNQSMENRRECIKMIYVKRMEKLKYKTAEELCILALDMDEWKRSVVELYGYIILVKEKINVNLFFSSGISHHSTHRLFPLDMAFSVQPPLNEYSPQVNYYRYLSLILTGRMVLNLRYFQKMTI